MKSRKISGESNSYPVYHKDMVPGKLYEDNEGNVVMKVDEGGRIYVYSDDLISTEGYVYRYPNHIGGKEVSYRLFEGTLEISN